MENIFKKENQKKIIKTKNQKKNVIVYSSKPITKLSKKINLARLRKNPLNYVYEMKSTHNIAQFSYISGLARIRLVCDLTSYVMYKNPKSPVILRLVNKRSVTKSPRESRLINKRGSQISFKESSKRVLETLSLLNEYLDIQASEIVKNANCLEILPEDQEVEDISNIIFSPEMFWNPLRNISDSVECVETHLIDEVLTEEMVQKVENLLSEATRSFASLNTIDVNSINNLVTSLKLAADSVSSVTNVSVGGTLDGLTKLLSSFLTFTPSSKLLIFLGALSSLIYFLTRSYCQGFLMKTPIALTLGVLVLTLPQSFKVDIMSLCTPLYDLLGKTTECVPQMGENFIENLTTTFAVGLFGWNCAKTQKTIGVYIKEYFSSTSKTMESMKTQVTSVIQLIQDITNYVSVNVFHHSSPIMFLNTLLPSLDELMTEVMTFSNQLALREIPLNKDNHDRLLSFKARAKNLLFKIPGGSTGNKMRLILSQIERAIDRISKNFEGATFIGSGYRQEPVSILLKSEPGTGKSSCVEFLICKIGSRVFEGEKLERFKKFSEEFIYSRMPETVYWDGYDASKEFVVVDDFAQCRDAVGVPDNEFAMIIRIINIYPCLLHMANITEKSNTFFVSKFVIATTNLTTFKPVSIVSPQAVIRRFTHVYIPRAIKEFRKGDTNVLDLSKYDAKAAFTPEMFEFVKTDFEGAAEYGVFTMDEVVDIIVKDHDIKKARHENKMELFRKILNDEYDHLVMGNLSTEDKNFETLIYYLRSNGCEVHEESTDKIMKLAQTLFPLEDLASVLSKKSQHIETRYFEMLSENFDFSTLWMPDSHLTTVKRILEDKVNFVTSCSKKCWEVVCKQEVGQLYRASFELLRNPGVMTLLGLVLGSFITKKMWNVKPSSQELTSPNIVINEVYPGTTPRSTSFNKFKDFRSSNRINHLNVNPQMAHSYDKNSADVVNKVVRNNCYEFHLEEEKGFVMSGFATFVVGTVFMVPLHFAIRITELLEHGQLNKTSHIRLVKSVSYVNGKFNTLEMMVSEFLSYTVLDDSMESKDFILVQLPRHYPQHKDITKCFLLEDCYASSANYVARIVAPTAGDFKESMNIKCRILGHQYSAEIIQTDGTNRRVVSGYWYSGTSTGPGDCGALFTSMNKNPSLGTIAGFHIAGNADAGYGISNFISREYLMEMLKLCPEVPIREELCSTIAYQPEMGLVDTHFEFDHNLPSRFVPEFKLQKPVSKPFRSEIVRSLLFECWDFKSLMRPAVLKPVLRNGVLIDPYIIARDKQVKPWINVDEVSLKNNTLAYYEHICSVSHKDVERRLYTFDEAVLGLKDDPDFKSISRKSSPGFPIVIDCSFPGKKKEGLLGTADEFDMNTVSLLRVKARVEQVIAASIDHVRLCHINMDNIKDEKRSIAKVLAAVSRLFSSTPLDQLILVRMYCGAFCNWFMKNRIVNGSAIGVDPASTEWDVIARHLSEILDHPRRFIAGDYSQFDNCELSVIQHAVFNIINWFYADNNVPNDLDERVRYLIFIEVSNGKHVSGDIIYSVNGGLSSGHPLTPIINTIYNLLILRMAWCDIAGNNSIVVAKLYDTYVRTIALGDDNVSAVHSSVKDVFVPSAVATSMNKVGMIYTSELKEECTGELRNIEEIEFLKRKFIFDASLFRSIAPLRLEVILEMPYWTKRKPSLFRMITCDNVQTSLMELSLHGRKVFDTWAPQMLKAAKEKLDYVPEHFKYESCYALMLSLGSCLS